MWKEIVFSILGFVSGCSFQELFGKKVKSKNHMKRNCPQSTDRREGSKTDINTHVDFEKKQCGNAAFSLNSIGEVFSAYNVEIISAGSFEVLLRKIKADCYKNLLKMFIDKATSPENMATMLREETTSAFVVNINPSAQPPFIDEEKLNKYIKEEDASPDEIGTIEEKIKFLLTISYARGIENFKRTLGAYLTEILDGAERGEDITELYQQAMKIIKSRYGYVS